MLLLVFIYKKFVSKHSITHVVLITIINYAKLYILINCNYMKFSYILFNKREFYLSTEVCEISKFPKRLMPRHGPMSTLPSIVPRVSSLGSMGVSMNNIIIFYLNEILIFFKCVLFFRICILFSQKL